MARKLLDRVREFTMTAGTGPIVLAGVPSADYLPFAPALSVGDSAPGVIIAQGRGQWEVVELTLLPDGRLSRGTPSSSSNGGAPVDFAPGRKEVFLAATAADQQAAVDAAGVVGSFDGRISGVNARVADQGQRIARVSSGVVPRVGTLSRMAVAPSGKVETRDGAQRGTEVALSNGMQQLAPTLDSLVRRADQALGQLVPRVSTYVGMAFDGAGKLTRLTDTTGSRVGDGASLISVPGQIVALRATAPAMVPRVGTMSYGRFSTDGVLVSGLDADGQPLYRDEFRALKKGITANTFPRIIFSRAAGILTSTADMSAIVLGYGQSYERNTAYDYLTATATWGNLTDIPGCYMPSTGVQPDGNAFSTLVPLRSLSTASVPIEAGEPPIIETVRAIREEWVAAGLTVMPRLIALSDGAGGQTIQTLMRGGSYYNRLLANLTTIVAIERAAGRRPVVVAFRYLQGEANRANVDFATRTAWAQWLSTLQRWVEADVRAITGQTEPVMLVTTSITRTNRPATVSLGAVDAALLNPGRIICAAPNYAVEHAADNHPGLVGARRLGRYCGRAIARSVWGLNQRMFRATRWWLASNTELRFDVDLPAGATTMVLDTSGAIVDMTTMDAGRGWTAWDRDGQVTISSVSASATNHPAGPAGDLGGATGSITFARGVHEGSLRAYYANSSAGIGGSLGGSVDGPRGCFRADDAYTVPNSPGLPTDVHSWLLPAELT